MIGKKFLAALGAAVIIASSLFALVTPVMAADGQWDIIKKPMDERGSWRENIKTGGYGTFTYENGAATIVKPAAAPDETMKYAMLISPTDFKLPDDVFTVSVVAKANPDTAMTADSLENEISVRTKTSGSAGEIVKIFLKYAADGNGLVTVVGEGGRETKALDTSVWHDYRFVASSKQSGDKRVYDIYVDGELFFAGIQSVKHTDGNTDLVRLGADNKFRADMSVKNVSAGNGDLSDVESGRILTLYASTNKVNFSEATELTATIETMNIVDETLAEVLLIDESGNPVADIATTATIINNTATASLTLPATLAEGKYYLQVTIGDATMQSSAIEVAAPVIDPDFPTFYPVKENIPLSDFKYNPTQEFIFPSVIDTQTNPLPGGATPIDRYYLFYAPHDAPGGIALMTAPTLDGPWKEYGNNPLISNKWINPTTGETYYDVTHVSAADIIYNTTYNKFFMYYHGENTTDRYATSTDLINWEYGGEIFRANDFSPTGTGLTEVSYGRVTEYPLVRDGETYKYIMTMMVNDKNDVRRIYLAYSKDGIDWITTQKPLISPENGKAAGVDYGTNIAGPKYLRWKDRNFIIVNASTGNLYAIEVGENFDKEIHLGLFYDSSDNWPDYGRSGGVELITDDDGNLHMFYEGGIRLHGNIIHAVSTDEAGAKRLNRVTMDLPEPSLTIGNTLTPPVHGFALDQNELNLNADSYTFSYKSTNPQVATFENGVITSVGEGTTEVWVEVTENGQTIKSKPQTVLSTEKLRIPAFREGTVMLQSADLPQGNADNLGSPSIIDAEAIYGDAALGKYYMYFSYDTRDTGVGLAYADDLAGPWTPYNEGKALIYRNMPDQSGGKLPGDANIAAPTVIWNDEEQLMYLYFTVNDGSVRLATSADGLSFDYQKALFSTNTDTFKGFTTKIARPAIYEYTIPGHDNKYVMIFGGKIGEMYQANYATSSDGWSWQMAPQPLDSPVQEYDGGNLLRPRLFFWLNRVYVLTTNDHGALIMSLVNEDFSGSSRWGTFYTPQPDNVDRGRASDPLLYQEDGTVYMFYTAGLSNNTTKIAMSSVAMGDLAGYDVMVEAVGGGSIAASSNRVEVGGDMYFSILPDVGCELESLMVNGEAVDLAALREAEGRWYYDVEHVTADIHAVATFTTIDDGSSTDDGTDDNVVDGLPVTGGGEAMLLTGVIAVVIGGMCLIRRGKTE